MRGRHQPVPLSEAGKLCLRAVQRWGSDERKPGVSLPLEKSLGQRQTPAFGPLRKHPPEPVPPEPDGFMADPNARLMQQIFHIS